MSKAKSQTGAANSANLLVVALAFAWGFNWIAAAVALREVDPWSLRFAGAGIGAATLFAVSLLTGHDLWVAPGERLHVMVAGFFNVAAFQILSAFAQANGATSRAIIISYSMPIWAALLSRVLLGERLNKIRLFAIMLCIAGLSILSWPVLARGFAPSVFLSLGCAWSWALATVYMKWVKASVPPLANASWQMLFGFVLIAAGTFLADGYPRLWALRSDSLIAVLYMGLVGLGFGYFLWWTIVGRLPAVTASLGALLVPVVGVIGSAIFIGERPTFPDVIGFMLIFAAAACVLLQPNVNHTEMPE